MSTAAALPAGPSPLEAAQQAVDHTRRHLFPFRLERWLALGFVAFLDQCGRHGTMGLNLPGPGGFGEGGPHRADLEAALGWLVAHVLLVSLITAAVLAVVVALTALVLWINSRGVFMYIDDVATGRAEVARPWREHGRHANSYFGWSFALTLVIMLVVLTLVLLGIAAVVMVARHRDAGAVLGALGLLLVVLLLIGSVLLASVASVALRDFVAPLQLQAGLACGDAAALFMRLLAAYPGAFIVYLLLKIVFAIALGIVFLFAACLTCCCAVLPVVGQTLLQPAFHFERAWSLHLLRQMGFDLLVPPGTGPWQGLPPPPRAPHTPAT